MTGHAEDTPVTFTASDWAKLQSIPTELKAIREILADSVRASQAETAAIRAAMVASDTRCDQQMKLANERIDEAHHRMHALDKRFMRWTVRWSAYTCALGIAVAAVWALLKFVTGRG